MSIELDDSDLLALASLRYKHQHIENAVDSLTRGLETGVFVWGEGGTGKSYTCQQKLDERKVPYILHNSRLTGRGLVDALQAYPSHIHWIEDAETLLDDPRAVGVLRSACWSQSNALPKVRPINWTAYRTNIRFEFTGGLLVVSNASLFDRAAEIRALQTRIKILRIDVSPAEVMALIKTICQQGFQAGTMRLSPGECWTVTEFVANHMSLLERPLDLRLVLNSFHDYLFARDHKATLSWQELVEARLKGAPTRFKTPKEKAIEERIIAQTIYAKTLTQAEKVAEWMSKTGKNRASFYNALNRSV